MSVIPPLVMCFEESGCRKSGNLTVYAHWQVLVDQLQKVCLRVVEGNDSCRRKKNENDKD